MKHKTIILTETDYQRLNSLLSQHSNLEDLENEIERAHIMSGSEIPSDLVTMDTTFKYLNVTDNKMGEMTIVYPQNANSGEKKISVTAPLGSALLGLRVGEEIDWKFPDGITRKLKVLEVVHQPEMQGDLRH
ncbi:MAG: nucleoside diphosphate kinase regulator [Bacteriovoracaceae bacterium]|nr:nucleoside diphosphate kinase regulator [Bacteriovoracaceae bacterium]